jgi:hypothetical protein
MLAACSDKKSACLAQDGPPLTRPRPAHAMPRKRTRRSSARWRARVAGRGLGVRRRRCSGPRRRTVARSPCELGCRRQSGRRVQTRRRRIVVFACGARHCAFGGRIFGKGAAGERDLLWAPRGRACMPPPADRRRSYSDVDAWRVARRGGPRSRARKAFPIWRVAAFERSAARGVARAARRLLRVPAPGSHHDTLAFCAHAHRSLRADRAADPPPAHQA